MPEIPEGDEARLTALVEALADGTPVDWAAAEESAPTDHDRIVIRRLSRIGLAASLQRRPSAPATWSHLVLKEKVGEGAFSDVFRAHDPRLARDVALKLLHEPMSLNAGRASAVIEEGRLLARVRHPNVVTVYGAETLNGQVGIWTEFVDGQTLQALVAERGPLPAEAVASIGLDLCRALSAVHEAGLLHRDIKAQNVMRGRTGRIVLMDFGTGRDASPQSGYEHDVSGTPLYLAPELFAGAQASVAADVYSLSVLLFFLLTGKYPVTGRTLKDIQAAHRAGRPAVSLRDLRPDVPEALAQAVDKGQAIDPSRRYASAQAFGDALTPAVPPQVRQFMTSIVGATLVGVVVLALIWFAVGELRRSAGVVTVPSPTSIVAAPTPTVVPEAPISTAVVDAPISTRTAHVEEWKGPQVHVEGGISQDGRYLSTVDAKGNIALRDLVTDTDRTLTKEGSPNIYAESAISRDGTQVAYTWHGADGRRNVLRSVRFNATSESPPITLFSDPDVTWIIPWDWSPDGTWIAVSLGRRDRTVHLALVSTVSPSLTDLRTVDWRGPTRMAFSPDGRFIAYDMPADDASQRDVFVMNVKTHQPTPAVVHRKNDVIAGWSPDGASLLFTSDRSGFFGVWELPMKNGAPAGKAKLIVQDIGPRSFPIGVSSQGALTYGQRLSSLNVYVAEVDFGTGKLLAPPVEATEHYLMENNSADWNADGSRLVFVSARPANMADIQKKLSILSVEGREPLRELRPELDDFQRPRWAPDGSITVQGTDLTGRQGIYRIDSQNGATSPLVQCEGSIRCAVASWFKDRTRLVYLRDNSTVLVRNIASATDEELRSVRGARLIGVGLSPDEAYVTYIHHDKQAGTGTLYLHPMAGGPPRALVTRHLPETLDNLAEWTPDSKYVVFGTSVNGEISTSKLWSVPVSGGYPVAIPELHPRPASTTLRVHPDGRHVSFSMGQQQLEVWTLSNFLPAPTAKK